MSSDRDAGDWSFIVRGRREIHDNHRRLTQNKGAFSAAGSVIPFIVEQFDKDLSTHTDMGRNAFIALGRVGMTSNPFGVGIAYWNPLEACSKFVWNKILSQRLEL